MSRPDISVIIATRNRAAILRRALAAVSHQETGGQFTYEIIISDNGSQDGTRAVVEMAAARWPGIRYVYEPIAGKAFALNRAIAQSAGGLLAFTDDDIRPPSGWLAALWRCADETGAEAIGGRIVPQWIGIEPGEETAQIIRHLGTIGCLDFGEARLQLSPSSTRYWWVGGNLAIRKSVLQRHGLFDERLKFVEDVEMFKRLRRAGIRIVYEPAAVVKHRVPADRLTPEALRRWYQQRGYYRVYTTPRRPYHLLTIMPLSWFQQVGQLAWAWCRTARRPETFWQRLSYECRLRACWSHLLHQLQLWPRRTGER